MAGKRGARPNAAPEPVGPALNGELLAERQKQVAVMNEHTRTVIEQFGDGLPWHPDHYEAEIRGELRRGCESFLRAGRYLVVARECAPHGEWQGMLARLGISQPQAHRMMEAARRIAALPNHSRANDLIAATGSQAKLIELLSLPEDQLTELATAGATGELEIDDLADMTRDELRAAVRKARDEVEARDEQIDTLKEERTRARREWVKTAPDAKVTKLRANVRAAADAVLAPLSLGDGGKGLHGAINALLEDEDAAQQDHASFLGGLFQELLGAVCVVRDNLPIDVPILEPRAPRIGGR